MLQRLVLEGEQELAEPLRILNRHRRVKRRLNDLRLSYNVRELPVNRLKVFFASGSIFSLRVDFGFAHPPQLCPCPHIRIFRSGCQELVDLLTYRVRVVVVQRLKALPRHVLGRPPRLQPCNAGILQHLGGVCLKLLRAEIQNVLKCHAFLKPRKTEFRKRAEYRHRLFQYYRNVSGNSCRLVVRKQLVRKSLRRIVGIHLHAAEIVYQLVVECVRLPAVGTDYPLLQARSVSQPQRVHFLRVVKLLCKGVVLRHVSQMPSDNVVNVLGNKCFSGAPGSLFGKAQTEKIHFVVRIVGNRAVIVSRPHREVVLRRVLFVTVHRHRYLVPEPRRFVVQKRRDRIRAFSLPVGKRSGYLCRIRLIQNKSSALRKGSLSRNVRLAVLRFFRGEFPDDHASGFVEQTPS